MKDYQPHVRELKLDEAFFFSFDIYKKNIKNILLLVLIVFIPLNILHYYMMPPAASYYGEPYDIGGHFEFWKAAVTAISSIFGLIAIGSAIYFSADTFRGGKSSFGEVIGAGLKYFVPLAITSIIFSFMFSIAFALLVIPGLLVLVYFSFYLPATVADGYTYITGLKESFNVSKPNFWKLLVFWIIWTLIAVAYGVISMYVIGITGNIAWYLVANFIFETGYLYLAIPPTIMYINLQDMRKDKMDRGENVDPGSITELP